MKNKVKYNKKLALGVKTLVESWRLSFSILGANYGVEIRLELENFVRFLASQRRPEVLARLASERTETFRENEYLSEWMDASEDRNYCGSCPP